MSNSLKCICNEDNETLETGGGCMSKRTMNWKSKKVNTSVNPQGYTEEDSNRQPKSQLEQRAKKKNTKI